MIQKKKRKKDIAAELKNQICDLECAYQKLSVSYNRIKNSYDKLENDYHTLKKEYDNILDLYLKQLENNKNKTRGYSSIELNLASDLYNRKLISKDYLNDLLISNY